VIERITTIRSPNSAIFGRCSLIIRPGAEVCRSWNGPPVGVPGLRSKVSIWLGPPSIHKRMHERLRLGARAASAASAGGQPDRPGPSTPAADSFSHSRRVKRVMGWVLSGEIPAGGGGVVYD